MKIGLLIEGACPGVNKFIHRLAESSQYDVIGFSRGWEGLYHDESVSVNTQMTSRFENLGGSVLSSSSVENIPKNFKYRMMQNLLKHDIDLLIIVGNEGSLQIANDLFSAGVRTVMIPSADFGLNVESYKMGLDTVAYELSECIHHLEKLSRNSNRKIVLSVSSRFKTLVEKMLQVHDFAWSVFCDRILISLDGSFENYDCSVKIDGVLTASKPLEKDLCFAHSLAEAVVSAWPLRGGSLVVYNGGFEFLPFQRFQKELALAVTKGDKNMKGEHPYVKWAIKSIEHWVRDHSMVDPLKDGAPKELLERKSGAFVSLHKLDGSLRGCIGTYLPVRANLAEEIRDNAIAAATEDPRFAPVAEEELDEIEVSVDILSEPEKVSDIDQLDPRKYGVIVISGFKRGLLLPDLAGVDTVEQQLAIAKRKAGIFHDEKVSIYRFTVERYH